MSAKLERPSSPNAWLLEVTYLQYAWAEMLGFIGIIVIWQLSANHSHWISIGEDYAKGLLPITFHSSRVMIYVSAGWGLRNNNGQKKSPFIFIIHFYVVPYSYHVHHHSKSATFHFRNGKSCQSSAAAIRESKNATWLWNEHTCLFGILIKHCAWCSSLFTCNFCPAWILVQSRTDGQIDRQKAMHMSPPCKSTGVLKNRTILGPWWTCCGQLWVWHMFWKWTCDGLYFTVLGVDLKITVLCVNLA